MTVGNSGSGCDWNEIHGIGGVLVPGRRACTSQGRLLRLLSGRCLVLRRALAYRQRAETWSEMKAFGQKSYQCGDTLKRLIW